MQVVREKLYRNLHQEVPYNARVMPVSFKTLTDGSWRFEQNIVVPTNHVSHPHASCSHDSRAAWGPTHACVILCQTCAWVMHFGVYSDAAEFFGATVYFGEVAFGIQRG